MNQNDREEPGPKVDDDIFPLMLPISGIIRWFQLRKIRKDLNNTKRFYDFDVNNKQEMEDRR